jgi:hypothetical protein
MSEIADEMTEILHVKTLSNPAHALKKTNSPAATGDSARRLDRIDRHIYDNQKFDNERNHAFDHREGAS